MHYGDELCCKNDKVDEPTTAGKIQTLYIVLLFCKMMTHNEAIITDYNMVLRVIQGFIAA